MLATLLGSCTMGFVLTADWRYGAVLGLVMGAGFSPLLMLLTLLK